ncbi:TPM domain-containing protein [Celeribacter neptunius]|uniref:TPM domain-containing protein n=1 Tax=Celeribacter neptunius TaxID=588602 RepID=UPI0011603B84|nr:TPM domain-containing protein [Celeribacter neptunius]
MRVFLFLSMFLCAVPAMAQDYPDYSEIYVNDFADLLGEAVEEDIRERLKTLRRETGVEFTVVTIGAMSDYGHHGEIEPFATGLFNSWGVGDAEKNDGLMMLVSRWDRKIRLEVGSGYGTSMNAPMQQVIDGDILPYFRKDRYEEGISNGVDRTILAVTGSWPGEYDFDAPQRLFGSFSRFITGLGNWIWAILAGFVPFPLMIYRRWKRNTPRICPNDGMKMTRLDEVWDDNHLQKGQITEEELRSVDYDVWQCPKCEHVKIEGYRAWFSQYSICRNCGYRTVEGDTTILESATTTSTGRKRIDYHCLNCGDEYSVTRTIPKVSKSSSSGGSFGGGSSSGGGASGSW